MKSLYSRIPLAFLLVVALIGTLMRSSVFIQLPLPYTHFLHSHSHIAFQGWVYTAMFLLLVDTFISEQRIRSARYPLQFKLTLVLLIGILIAFLLQGYGVGSIAVSTLFQVLTYWFIYRFFVDGRSQNERSPMALKFIGTGLIFGIISTLAPYFIGYLAATGQKGTDLYDAGVYFFLHFQYNGWFLFVLLGLWIKPIEEEGWIRPSVKLGHGTLTLATVFGYFLSLLGTQYRIISIVPSAIAIILQIIGLVIILPMLFRGSGIIWKRSGWGLRFGLFSLSALALKVILQSISILPSLQDLAFGNRDLIIAYMHLCLIGFISFGYLSLIHSRGWFRSDGWSGTGSSLLMLGFVVTELSLVHSSLSGNPHTTVLFVFSLLMALGILLLLLSVGRAPKGVSR